MGPKDAEHFYMCGLELCGGECGRQRRGDARAGQLMERTGCVCARKRVTYVVLWRAPLEEDPPAMVVCVRLSGERG